MKPKLQKTEQLLLDIPDEVLRLIGTITLYYDYPTKRWPWQAWQVEMAKMDLAIFNPLKFGRTKFNEN